MANSFVDTESVFDFIKNPFRDGFSLGHNSQRVWVLKTPEEGERYKYQACNPASQEESDYYWSVIGEATRDRYESYNRMVQEHLDNGGSMSDF